jgi:hypothetical protein
MEGMSRKCDSEAPIVGGAPVVVGDRESLLQGEGEQFKQLARQISCP